jgi:hypothetical protein
MPADSISVDGSKIQVTMGGSRHVFEGEEREIPSNYAEGAFKIEASALPGAPLHPSPATLHPCTLLRSTVHLSLHACLGCWQVENPSAVTGPLHMPPDHFGPWFDRRQDIMYGRAYPASHSVPIGCTPPHKPFCAHTFCLPQESQQRRPPSPAVTIHECCPSPFVALCAGIGLSAPWKREPYSARSTSQSPPSL